MFDDLKKKDDCHVKEGQAGKMADKAKDCACEKGREMVDTVKEKGCDAIETAKEKGREVMDTVKDKGREMMDTVKEKVGDFVKDK